MRTYSERMASRKKPIKKYCIDKGTLVEYVAEMLKNSRLILPLTITIKPVRLEGFCAVTVTEE